MENFELITGFQFNVSSRKIKITPDKNHIIVSGIYGPQIKIFDTHEMSLKCLWGLDSEVVDFQILSDDYKKLAMVCEDRNIEIHS